MVRVEEIVAHRVNGLKKNILGQVSKKNAENAVAKTAQEVKELLLEEKQKAVDAILENVAKMKADYVSEINKKDSQILDLSNQNQFLEQDKKDLATKNEEQGKLITTLKEQVIKLVHKVKKKMPFTLIGEAQDGTKTFAKPNRNGAKMIKTVSKDGNLDKLEVVLLDGRSRILVANTQQKPLITNIEKRTNVVGTNKLFAAEKTKEPIATNTKPPKEKLSPNTNDVQPKIAEAPKNEPVVASSVPPKETLRQQIKDIQPKTPEAPRNENVGTSKPTLVLKKVDTKKPGFPIRKYFLENGLEYERPKMINLPEDGEIITEYDHKTGRVLKKEHYVTKKNSRRFWALSGTLHDIEEYNPKTGKITKRTVYDSFGNLSEIEHFNEEGIRVEKRIYQNFKSTYDCGSMSDGNSYLQEYLYISEIIKCDPKTGQEIELIRGNGERSWQIAQFKPKSGLGLVYSDDINDLQTAGLTGLKGKGNINAVTTHHGDRTDWNCPTVYWELKDLKEAPLPEMEKVHYIKKKNHKTGEWDLVYGEDALIRKKANK